MGVPFKSNQIARTFASVWSRLKPNDLYLSLPVGTEEALDVDQLRQFVDFMYLPDDVLAVTLEQLNVCKKNRGEIVFECGDADGMQLFLLSGSIKLIAKDGREHILQYGSDDSHWPISRLRPRLYTAIAAEMVEYFLVSTDSLNILRERFGPIGKSIFDPDYRHHLNYCH